MHPSSCISDAHVATGTYSTSKDPALDFLGSFVTTDPTTSLIVAPAGVGGMPLAPTFLPSSFFVAAAEVSFSASGVLGNRRTIGGGGGATLCVAEESIRDGRRKRNILHHYGGAKEDVRGSF